MQALLKSVREGDLVLCDKLDRWSRDPEFTYKSIREILEAKASFYSVGDQCDPSTRDGDTLLNFRVLFAREEHKRIKERMVGTRHLLKDQGYFADGLAPAGYKRSYPKGFKGPEKNILAIDEPVAARIRKAFALAIAGSSLLEIEKAISVAGERPYYDFTRIARILRDRIYLGQLKNSKGEWIRGRHEPIIDVATFAAADAAVTSRRFSTVSQSTFSPTSQTANWMLRDVAMCGACKRKLTSAYQRNKRAPRHYYLCARKDCEERTTRLDAAEAGVEDAVLARLEELREELARAPESTEQLVPDATAIAAQRHRLVSKRERLLDMFADGHVTRAQLAERMGAVDKGLIDLKAREHAATTPNPLADASVRREVLRSVATIRRAWRGAQGQDRRTLVRLLAERAFIQRDHETEIVWKPVETLLRGTNDS